MMILMQMYLRAFYSFGKRRFPHGKKSQKYVLPSVNTIPSSHKIHNKYYLLIMVYEVNNTHGFKTTRGPYLMTMKYCPYQFEELDISSVSLQCFIPLLNLSFFLTFLTLSFRNIEKCWRCMAKRWSRPLYK